MYWYFLLLVWQNFSISLPGALVSHSYGHMSKYQQCQNTPDTQLCAVREVTGALQPKATNTSLSIREQPKVQVR